MVERKCKGCGAAVKGHKGPVGAGKCQNPPVAGDADQTEVTNDSRQDTTNPPPTDAGPKKTGRGAAKGKKGKDVEEATDETLTEVSEKAPSKSARGRNKKDAKKEDTETSNNEDDVAENKKEEAKSKPAGRGRKKKETEEEDKQKEDENETIDTDINKEENETSLESDLVEEKKEEPKSKPAGKGRKKKGTEEDKSKEDRDETMDAENKEENDASVVNDMTKEEKVETKSKPAGRGRKKKATVEDKAEDVDETKDDDSAKAENVESDIVEDSNEQDKRDSEEEMEEPKSNRGKQRKAPVETNKEKVKSKEAEDDVKDNEISISNEAKDDKKSKSSKRAQKNKKVEDLDDSGDAETDKTQEKGPSNKKRKTEDSENEKPEDESNENEKDISEKEGMYIDHTDKEEQRKDNEQKDVEDNTMDVSESQNNENTAENATKANTEATEAPLDDIPDNDKDAENHESLDDDTDETVTKNKNDNDNENKNEDDNKVLEGTFVVENDNDEEENDYEKTTTDGEQKKKGKKNQSRRRTFVIGDTENAGSQDDQATLPEDINEESMNCEEQDFTLDLSKQSDRGCNRERLFSKSDQDFDVRTFLTNRSFLLCGCNYFDDDEDELYACDCNARIHFNKDHSGTVSGVFFNPLLEDEDFMPPFKANKSSWNSDSPNKLTLKFGKIKNKQITSVNGQIDISGERYLEVEKGRKIRVLYFSAVMSFEISGSKAFLNKLKAKGPLYADVCNPIKFKSINFDLINSQDSIEDCTFTSEDKIVAKSADITTSTAATWFCDIADNSKSVGDESSAKDKVGNVSATAAELSAKEE